MKKYINGIFITLPIYYYIIRFVFFFLVYFKKINLIFNKGYTNQIEVKNQRTVKIILFRPKIWYINDKHHHQLKHLETL